jgi:acetylxylan esterase
MILLKPSLLVLTALAALGFGASLVQIKDFGANPTKINMYIYVPDKLATKPAVIVAVGVSLRAEGTTVLT